MSIGSKRELFAVVQRRYHRSTKKQRGAILDEFSANTGLQRKYVIRLLNRGYKRGRKKPGPVGQYRSDPRFLMALRALWKLSDYACGKLLKAMIPELMARSECSEGLSDEMREKLLRVSHSTIDRVLREYRALHGKSLTKPGSIMRTEIPIQGSVWDESVPGFIEADLVAHVAHHPRARL